MEESPPLGTVPRLLFATSAQNSLYEECTFGNAITDAMVKYTGADIAIINGGVLTGNLQHGDAYEKDISEAISTDCQLALAEVNTKQLYSMLEASISHVVVDESKHYDTRLSPHAAFPQISGFRIAYDPAAEPGQRISRVTYNNKPINISDTETTYTLVSSVNYFNGEYGTPVIEDYTVSEESLHSVLKKYIREGIDRDKYALTEKRIYAMEVQTGLFSSNYTVFTVAAICIIFFTFIAIPTKWRKMNTRKNDFADNTNKESEEIT